MQSWTLERKIQVTQTRIIKWYQKNNGKVYVSFSGGKDSTVLLDLARRIYPDIPAVFIDAGLKYPELREFVKNDSQCTWLKPKMNFRRVIEKMLIDCYEMTFVKQKDLTRRRLTRKATAVPEVPLYQQFSEHRRKNSSGMIFGLWARLRWPESCIQALPWVGST